MGCLGKRFTAKAIHINARFRCQPQINSSYSLSTCDFVFKSARSWENGAFACENELNQHPKAPIISKDIQTASFICLHLSEVLLQFREAKGEVNLYKCTRSFVLFISKSFQLDIPMVVWFQKLCYKFSCLKTWLENPAST